MGQIIQICKLFSFFLIFFLSSNLLNSNERNQFGNYLSWSYARLKGDVPKVGEYYSDIDWILRPHLVILSGSESDKDHVDKIQQLIENLQK